MLIKSINLLKLAGLLVWLSLAAVTAEAQVQKRVVFAKGKSSATYAGRLPRNYADYDAYFFRARKGQELIVNLYTADPDAWLAIYETKELGPDEDLISTGVENPRDWVGRLPITSEYSVQVYGVLASGQHSNRAAYRIETIIR